MPKFFENPPENMLFKDLFNYFRKQGVGNELGEDGRPQRWRNEKLAEEFEALGYPIQTRSFGHWAKGTNVAQGNNITALARIASGGNRERETRWRSAIVKSTLVKEAAENLTSAKLTTQPSLVHPTKPTTASTKKTLAVGIAVAATLLAASFLLNFLDRPLPDVFLEQTGTASDGLGASGAPLPLVGNMRVCDEANFNKQKLACARHVPFFPIGTQKVYLSFVIDHMLDGQRFERRWYRNGERFKAVSDYFDEAWPGYTWLANSNGHDSGEYSVRIIVGDRAATQSFTIGLE